jgi:hypothetical protein
MVLSGCGGSRQFRPRPLETVLADRESDVIEASLHRPARVKDGCSAIVVLMIDDEVIEKRDEGVEFGKPRSR